MSEETQALLPVTPELLPCPFCWTSAHLSYQWPGSMTADMPDRPCRVICSHIDHDTVVGPTGYGKRAAITAWNTRISHSLPGDWIFDVEPSVGATSPEPSLRKIVSGYYGAHFPSDRADKLTADYFAALTPSPCPGDGMREASVLPVHPIDMLREMLAREIARTSTTESFMIRSGLLADLLDELASFRQLHSLPAEPVSLAEKILWHVEQVCGPLSTETVENPGDDDRSVLSHNIRAVLTPSALSGQGNHQFVQNPVMPFSSCQICLAPEDVHAARQGSE